MDKYQDVRSIPLGSLLALMGFTGFKKTAGKTGTLREMSVPSTQEKQHVFLGSRMRNSTAFLAGSMEVAQSTL